jgi:hypothetical protein
MGIERAYARISPRFWTGRTGDKIKRRGFEGVVVAVYLMTSPHSNMLGLYRQPVMYMAEETGLTIEGASKGLRICIDAGFCAYHEATKMVWVFEMANYQIAETLSPGDKRCSGIRKDYATLPNCPFLGPFFDRYAQAFHLDARRDFEPEDDDLFGSPFEAPSKQGEGEGEGEGSGAGEGAFTPLASLAPSGGSRKIPATLPPPQQPDDFDLSGETPPPPAKPARARRTTPAAPKPPKPPKAPAPSTAAWEAYAEAYGNRYGCEPVRNAQVNAQLAQLVGKLGADEAPAVAGFYVGHNGAIYVRSMHDTSLLLRDAAALRTQWATRRQVTATQAQQADRTQTNANAFGPMLEAAQARERAAAARQADVDLQERAA